MLKDAAAASAAAVRTWFQVVQPVTYAAQSLAPPGSAGAMADNESFLGTLNTMVTNTVPTS